MPTRRQILLGAAANVAATSLPLRVWGQREPGLAKLRAIVSGTPARQWQDVPGTAMRPVVPPQSMAVYGATGPASVLSAWNGAAYDPASQRLYFWGGGHTDYGGNEVYELDLEHLHIERLTDPSPLTALPLPSSDSRCRIPADGTPLSSHDYDGIVWCPLTNSIWLWPAIGFCSSAMFRTSGQCWEFNPARKKWHRGPNVPAGRLGYFNACWVGKHKKILLQTTGISCWFDPVSRTYSGWSRDWATFGECVSCYVEHRDEVWICFGEIIKIPLSEPTPGMESLVIAYKDMPPGIGGTSGLLYDPASRMIILWPGGGDVWALNPDTLEWRFVPATTQAPVPHAHAVMSKWKYVAELATCVAYGDIDHGLWLWKPGNLAQVMVYKEIAGFIVQNADGSDPRAFKRASDAANAVRDGQTIRILKNPYGAWREGLEIKANNVTIQGDPGARLYGVAVAGGIGLIAGYGNNLAIEDLEIFDVRGDGTASGVRFLGKNLTLRNVNIHHCDMGLLSAGDNGVILLDKVVISDCGGHNGQSHNIYVSESERGSASRFIFRRSQSLRAQGEGHLLKSRALATEIESSIMAMLDAHSSRCIDIPDGGDVTIRACVIQQGPKSDNEDIVGVALELAGEHLAPGLSRHHSTLIEDNIVISDFHALMIGLVHTRSPASVGLKGNTVVISDTGTQFVLAYPDSHPNGGVRDLGSNKIIEGRGAAGFKPYPWLPALPVT